MAEAKLKITIDTDYRGKSETSRVQKDLKGIGDAAKDASKPIKELTENIKNAETPVMDLFSAISSQALAATAVIAGFGVAFKAAMDFGETGAKVEQTAASFDGLLAHIGANKDLLIELRSASRGTVDDMTLMSATTTLLAGAQGELATQLGNATPRLLEIAKAANKLNPTLGDTTFLYESLALGIKRGSPMILDNLGLTIKIEEANKKFAESLGKTAEKLTAEEQKQALLNETLRAGGVLIQQAGGNTDSAADSFARLNTATKNLSDSLATKLAPWAINVADALTLMITASDQLDSAITNHNKEIVKTADSFGVYVTELTRANVAAGKMSETDKFWLDQFAKGNKELPRRVEHYEMLFEKYGLLTKAQFDSVRGYDMEDQRLRRVTQARGDSTGKINDENKARQELNAQMAILNAALAGPVKRANEEYDASITSLLANQQKLTEEIANYTAANGQAIPMAADMTQRQHQQTLAIYEVSKSYGELNGVQAQIAEKQKMLNQALSQGANPDWINILRGTLHTLAGEQSRVVVQIDAAKANQEKWNKSIADGQPGVANYTGKLDELKKKYGENQTEIDKLNAKFKTQIDQMLYAAAASTLTQDDLAKGGAAALMDLGVSLGLVDAKTAAVYSSFASLAKQNREDGKPAWEGQIDLAGRYEKVLAEKVVTAVEKTKDGDEKLALMYKTTKPARDQTWIDVVSLSGAYDKLADSATKANKAIGNTPKTIGGTSVSGGVDFTNTDIGGITERDSGGYGEAGTPYLIGRGAQPEMFVPKTDGYFFPNADRMNTSVTHNHYYYANDDLDIELIAEKVAERIKG